MAASYASVTIPPFRNAGGLVYPQTAGGLVGASIGGGLTIAAYSTGCVTIETNNPNGGNGHIGGVVGYLQGAGATVTNSYFNSQVCRSPAKNDVATRGKTTAELQTPTGYTGIYANWDLDGDGAADNPWIFGTALEYPSTGG